MARDGAGKLGTKARMAAELREFAVIGVYLWVCFTALAYLKFAILEAHGIAFAPFGFAAIKALICAKFVLIGNALHVGERFKTRPLVYPVLHKSLAFLLLLLVLNVLEEVISGFLHGRALAETLGEIGGGTRDQMIATAIVMLLILIPFFVVRAIGEVVGEHNLVRLFFEPRRMPEKRTRPS